MLWAVAPAAALAPAVASGPCAPRAAPPDAPASRFTLGFDALPRGLERGRPFSLPGAPALGAIVLVDRPLRFVSVETQDPPRLVACLRAQSGVRYVEETPTLRLLDAAPTDDPYVRDGRAYGPAAIGAPAGPNRNAADG